MRIHNILSDHLLALSNYLNKDVLYSAITRFEYNIGNQSFQLDYNPQFKLPAGIVKFDESRQFLRRPYSYQFRNFGNHEIIPVLHNETKDLTLSIQEEQWTLNCTILVNCESQLQAMEIKHNIEAIIPIEKYLNMYEFTSFMTLQDFIFNPCLFDLSKDKIINLFQRHNTYTDTIEYCFGIRYNPLVRLNALSLGIDSSDSPTFQVACDFELMTPIPVAIIYPELPSSYLPECDALVTKRHNKWVPVGDYDYIQIYNYHVEPNKKWRTVVTTPIVNGLDDQTVFTQSFEFIGEDNSNVINATVSGKSPSETTTWDVNIIHKSDPVIAKTTFFFNRKDVTLRGKITGDNISGDLTDIEIDYENGYFDCWFNGDLLGNVTTETIRIYIVNQSEWIKKFVDIRVVFNNSKEYLTREKFIIPTKSVFDAVKDITKEISTIKEAKITAVKLLHKTNKVIEEVILDSPKTLPFIFTHNTIEYLVSGSIDKDNGDTDIVLTNNDDPNLSIDYDLDQLLFNFLFNIQKDVLQNIDRISLNFSIVNQVITDINTLQLSSDINTNVNLIISEDLAPEKITKPGHAQSQEFIYKFKININGLTTLEDLYWRFIFPNKTITNSDRFEVTFVQEESTISELVFTCEEQYYRKMFANFSKTNPLFFSLGTNK